MLGLRIYFRNYFDYARYAELSYIDKGEINRGKMLKMIIRKYQPSDCKELTELFYNTVHNVNAKDYTKEVHFSCI